MCFEIFNEATDNAPELTEVYALTNVLKKLENNIDLFTY